MNLEPSIWGPHFWNMFHFISSTYDNKPNQSIKLTMKNFIQSIPVFLPCKECQDHAFDFLRSSNLDKIVENRKELFTFFFNFHNSVNLRLKKPLMKIEDALKKYYIPVEEYHLYIPSKKIIGPIFGSVESAESAKSVGFPLLILMVIIIIVFTIFK
ncbi:Ervl/Alr family protein [Invertebrate iridescent virus 22]|uniref:Sulfhydryl oxidase n=1 Tax=Invertebrate iridescent virus 22 TaxID=345198 RepID=W8W1X9_9VIRU|nr:Ervl/Alr family protein [Invertebrate iridescent virus 22]CCV01861.1 Ervl/Alr family protein [Invertebrate iridescent virus 22]